MLKMRLSVIPLLEKLPLPFEHASCGNPAILIGDLYALLHHVATGRGTVGRATSMGTTLALWCFAHKDGTNPKWKSTSAIPEFFSPSAKSLSEPDKRTVICFN
jgi:hypothetical protein